MKRRFVFLFVLSCSIFLASSFSQNKKQKQRPQPLTKEQYIEQLNKRIETLFESYAEKMGDLAPNEEQRDPFLKAITQSVYDREKIRMQMRALRQGGDREGMMALRGKGEKIGADYVKAMKEILEKKQFKAFKKAKSKIEPEPSGGPGGGRGPGGGGGGRGAGGGGGPGGGGF